MAISPEQLSNIIQGRAKTLCQPTAAEQKRINTVQSKEDIGFGTDGLGVDGGSFDIRGAFNERLKKKGISMDNAESTQDYTNNDYITESAFAKSGLPNDIKEAMKSRVKVVPDSEISTTYQDTIPAPQVAPVQAQAAGGIDYSVLRAIINDCLNNYFSSKGTLETIQLSGGNIKLIDNKGNTYQAKLEKVTK